MRRATVRTRHADAASVARALAPDNTTEMETVVVDGDSDDSAAGDSDDSAADGSVVETTVERGTTGGLHATVDDYLVNLHVAVQCTNDAEHNNTQ